MSAAEARASAVLHDQAPLVSDPTRFELDEVELLSEDELTALLQRRFRRFLALGFDDRRALLLAAGIGCAA